MNLKISAKLMRISIQVIEIMLNEEEEHSDESSDIEKPLQKKYIF